MVTARPPATWALNIFSPSAVFSWESAKLLVILLASQCASSRPTPVSPHGDDPGVPGLER